MIVNKKLKKKVIKLKAEKEETLKCSKMLNEKMEDFEEKIKEWKSKCKLKRKCSEERKAKLKHSEDLHDFAAPT